MATLASTTLNGAVARGDTSVRLASTTDITQTGLWIFVDGEAMNVLGMPNLEGDIAVQRGVGSTAAIPHATGDTVYIGTSAQFYLQDPEGVPPEWPDVLPYINLRTGGIWNVSGDAWIPVGGTGGGGDVTGPPTAVDGNLAAFDGTTGTLLKDSGVTTGPAPAGSDTQVQFFDGTGFGGDAAFTFTKATGALTSTTYNKITFTPPASSATLTLITGSALVTAGAHSITLTSTADTNVTLPTTGTLATLAGSEALSNKSYAGSTIDLSGDCKAATFHVGASAGADSGGALGTITSITVVKGIVTAITGSA